MKQIRLIIVIFLSITLFNSFGQLKVIEGNYVKLIKKQFLFFKYYVKAPENIYLFKSDSVFLKFYEGMGLQDFYSSGYISYKKDTIILNSFFNNIISNKIPTKEIVNKERKGSVIIFKFSCNSSSLSNDVKVTINDSLNYTIKPIDIIIGLLNYKIKTIEISHLKINDLQQFDLVKYDVKDTNANEILIFLPNNFHGAEYAFIKNEKWFYLNKNTLINENKIKLRKVSDKWVKRNQKNISNCW